MTTIQTNDGSRYQKPTTMATAGAVLAGSTIQGTIASANDFAAFPLMGKMRALNNPKDSVVISNALKKGLENAGLKDKVNLIEYDSNSYKNMKEFFKGIYQRVKTGKSKFKEELLLLQTNMIREGFNAGFSPIGNAVHINTQKMGLAGFHEIGHAINFNNSKFWKAMQKYRFSAIPIAGLLALTALCKRKKVEGEEPTGTFDKITTFIKNNVGKLTFAAMLPVVAEEMKATARGNKIAKELLNPELYQKVVKSNRLGALTYVGMAVLLSVGAYAANKVRDAIAKPKQIA